MNLKIIVLTVFAIAIAGTMFFLKKPRTFICNPAEETASSANQQGIAYCQKVILATRGDQKALREVLFMRFDAAAALGHGVMLVEVIDRAGENAVFDVLQGSTSDEKKALGHYLEAGLAYTLDKKYARKQTADVYPLINSVLSVN